MYKLEINNEEFNLFTEVWKTGLDGLREKLEMADINELKRAYKDHGFTYGELNGKVTKERLIERMMRFAKQIQGFNENMVYPFAEGVKEQLRLIRE